ILYNCESVYGSYLEFAIYTIFIPHTDTRILCISRTLGMSRKQIRSCKGCQRHLPEGAHHRRRYCSRRCRERMKKRREAVAKTPVEEQELARLKDVESNYDQLEILYMREQESWQTLINKKNRRIRNLQHALRTAEHQVEV